MRYVLVSALVGFAACLWLDSCTTPTILVPLDPHRGWVACLAADDAGALHATGGWCPEGSVCGGDFPNVGCPKGACCWVGR